MCKILLFFLFFIIFNCSFGKLQVISEKKDESLGYPIYRLKVDKYDKEKEFGEFFLSIKDIRKKDLADEISFLLINDNFDILDRIDIKFGKFIVLNSTGSIYEYTEKEFLDSRNNKNTNKNLDGPLNFNIVEKNISGINRLTVRVKLNRNATSMELNEISRQIYKNNRNNVLDPQTKKKKIIENMVIFYYLPNQNTESGAYASFEVNSIKVIEKFIYN